MEQLEGIQYQVDQLAEKYHRDKLALFREVEVVIPVLYKAKYKMKWNLPLNMPVKYPYVQNLVLKRRLRLVMNKLTEVKEAKRKMKRGKLELLVEASTKVNLQWETLAQL